MADESAARADGLVDALDHRLEHRAVDLVLLTVLHVRNDQRPWSGIARIVLMQTNRLRGHMQGVVGAVDDQRRRETFCTFDGLLRVVLHIRLVGLRRNVGTARPAICATRFGVAAQLRINVCLSFRIQR